MDTDRDDVGRPRLCTPVGVPRDEVRSLGSSERPSTAPGGRSRRLARRIGLLSCALLVLAVAVGVSGYVLTPSVGDAPARVRALARAHGVAHADAPVPRRFAEAIVASEDSRFYLEPGVDPIGVVRAGWLALTSTGTDGGGSTISQQLAKLLYTGGRSGLRRDLEQVALAVKLNIDYSKAQILRMYAATVYFGHGFYGLHQAACGYFGVPPPALTLARASMLAGLVQAPSAYDPLAHLSLARARQRYVVGRLAADGVVSRGQARRMLRAPLGLRRGRPAAGCGRSATATGRGPGSRG